jgi:hypothetical protein
MRFRKKPVEIDAIQWLHDPVDASKNNYAQIALFTNGACDLDDFDGLFIHTLEGNHKATNGDWIIKGVKGEFYPCKPDIFELTYEPVEAMP